jgi:DNA-binding transcriptional regulator YiaG
VNGVEIREARERMGMTQEQLAQQIGVHLRTVGNWERGQTVPKNRMARLRRVLGEDGGNPLAEATDAELLAEVARRFRYGGVQ